MTKKMYSVPAYGMDGREFSLLCLMTDSQIIEMSRMGKFVVRMDCAAEVIALVEADANTVASLEAEGHRMDGGVMQ